MKLSLTLSVAALWLASTAHAQVFTEAEGDLDAEVEVQAEAPGIEVIDHPETQTQGVAPDPVSTPTTAPPAPSAPPPAQVAAQSAQPVQPRGGGARSAVSSYRLARSIKSTVTLSLMGGLTLGLAIWMARNDVCLAEACQPLRLSVGVFSAVLLTGALASMASLIRKVRRRRAARAGYSATELLMEEPALFRF